MLLIVIDHAVPPAWTPAMAPKVSPPSIALGIILATLAGCDSETAFLTTTVPVELPAPLLQLREVDRQRLSLEAVVALNSFAGDADLLVFDDPSLREGSEVCIAAASSADSTLDVCDLPPGGPYYIAVSGWTDANYEIGAAPRSTGMASPVDGLEGPEQRPGTEIVVPQTRPEPQPVATVPSRPAPNPLGPTPTTAQPRPVDDGQDSGGGGGGGGIGWFWAALSLGVALRRRKVR